MLQRRRDPSYDGEQGRETELAEIEAVADRFAGAVRSGDVEDFAELFTEDATYAANNGQFLEGRGEILAAAREWFRCILPVLKFHAAFPLVGQYRCP